jgi:nitronate monooxygenase
MTLRTAFTSKFDLSVPIVQAPMGGVAGPDLVATAANTGALAILPIWFVPPMTPGMQSSEPASSCRPFAVNLRADLTSTTISPAIDAGISLLTCSGAIRHPRCR